MVDPSMVTMEVILGLPGAWAANPREKSNHNTIKIGGLPDWPFPESDIKQELLNCGLCGTRLCLVAQVYAPVSSADLKIERVLYILGCSLSRCAGDPKSWRALRIQKCHDCLPSESNSPKEKELGTHDCLSTSSQSKEDLLINSFGNVDKGDDDSMDLDALSQAFSELASMKPQPKKKDGSSHSEATKKSNVAAPRADHSSIPTLPCFYVYGQTIQPRNDIGKVGDSYSSLPIQENGFSLPEEEKEEAWEGETYEYDKALGAERTYLKFKKQLDAYPEQCFRYSYGGCPLLAIADLAKPDKCKICGSPRHFEMQLMPSLLYFLNEASGYSLVDIPEEWNWLTLMIFSCSKSCSSSNCKESCSAHCWSVIEEAVVVQNE